MYVPGLREPPDWRILLAAGAYPDLTLFNKFGVNPSVGTSFEVIEAAGGTYPFPTSAQTVRVRSGGDTADTVAGANARKIIVQGINSNMELASEEIDLAGASASAPTIASWWRVFRAYVTEVGTYGVTNAAAIVIENTSDTDALLTIRAGEGQSQAAMMATPSGYVGAITRFNTSVDTGKTVTTRLMIRRDFNNTSTNIRPARVQIELDGIQDAAERRGGPLIVPEATDFWVESVVTTGTAVLSASFDLTLIPTTWLRG